MLTKDKHGCCWKASVRFPSELDPATHGCHTLWRTLTAMKMKRMLEFLRPQEELIATFFGQAQLVRTLDGKSELRGGTAEDRQAAKEWISMFWQGAVRFTE